MAFRQFVIRISPGLLYAEQTGRSVKIVYAALPTMYITFRKASDANEFFNEAKFEEGEIIVAPEAIGIELFKQD